MSAYKMGYGKNMMTLLQKRTVQNNAGFLLNHLKPNMNLLDCGCGPGTITVGLAKLLNKGTITGIDIEQSQVEMSRKLAQKEHLENTTFQQANILDLPFARNTFDVVFTHAVLSHLNNHVEIVKKLLHIIKPGGILAAREIDFGVSVFYPQNNLMDEFNQLRIKLKTLSSDVNVGRKLRSIFFSAGCDNVISSASTETPDAKSIANHYILESDNLLWQEALKDGLVTQTKLNDFKNAWEDFGANRESFVSWTWFEAVGFKKR